jgi:hypothetical protein
MMGFVQGKGTTILGVVSLCVFAGFLMMLVWILR